MVPVPVGFWWCRFGGFGRQLAHVVGLYKADQVEVQKWRDNSRRWTGRVRVFRSQLLAPALLSDPVVRRAVKAATPGKPYCRDTHHDGALELQHGALGAVARVLA